jgi:hypothetical protein
MRACIICKKSDPNTAIPALGHQWGGWTHIAPTCTEAGSETRICANDSSHIDTHTEDALGHDWGEWAHITSATVTTDGEDKRACGRDHTHEETRPLYATGTPGLAFELSYIGTEYYVGHGTVTEGDVYIPAYWRQNAEAEYFPVTQIASSRYDDDSQKYIGAFEGTGITAVHIGTNVTDIGEAAFLYCTSLASITIPDSVTSIWRFAFSGCTSLTGVTIPNSDIWIYAFGNCTSLESVTIESGMIDSMVFSGCTSLASVTLGSGVTRIEGTVFNDCTSLSAINVDAANKNYSSANGVVYNKDQSTLVVYPRGKAATSFTIPNSVTIIGIAAFLYCTSLTGVTIPNSVTSIGYKAFASCTSLASVTFAGTIPTSGFSIDEAFMGDLRDKFYEVNVSNGTPGTYTTPNPESYNSVWTKQ